MKPAVAVTTSVSPVCVGARYTILGMLQNYKH